MRMRFLPDEPIQSLEVDLLGLGDFVQLVRTAVEDTVPPYVFGLLGDWGTGKTSALHLLADSFDKRFVPIRFNAWLYENEANVIYPLLHAIKKSYEAKVPKQAEKEGFLGTFARVAAATALSMADLGLRVATKTATGEALSLEDVAGHLERVEAEVGLVEKVLGKWVDEVDNLRNSFQQLLDLYSRDYAAAERVPVAVSSS
jgi:hypothetical protein